MPLRIRMAPGEELIVNGAVIRNGDRRNTITVVNPANVIRGRDILFDHEATTPVRRAYFLIQSLVITAGDDKVGIRPKITDALAELYASSRSDEVRNLVMEAANQFTAEDYYKALAALRELLPHEDAAFGLAAGNKEDSDVDADQSSDHLELVP